VSNSKKLIILITSSVLIIAILGSLGIFYYTNNLNKSSSSSSQASSVSIQTGLSYIDLKVGSGKEVKTGSRVKAHYLGTLLDGKKFDSSYDRNEPFTAQIGVGQLIRGWDLAIPGMKEGGKRKLTISPDLAYGDRDIPGIPANSTLLFEVEVLEVLN